MYDRWSRVLCVVAIATVLVAMPLSWVDHGPSLCLIKAVTGHECPGCGMTRALMHALHGDLSMAWEYNRSWVLVAPLMLYGIVRWMVPPVRRRRAQVPDVPSSPIV